MLFTSESTGAGTSTVQIRTRVRRRDAFLGFHRSRSLRILFLTNAHNSLSQRALLDLSFKGGHSVRVEIARSEDSMLQAVADHHPELIICPFLTKRVPMQIWSDSTVPCWIVHPGIEGDRGISALDWALLRGTSTWGVTGMLMCSCVALDSGAAHAVLPYL